MSPFFPIEVSSIILDYLPYPDVLHAISMFDSQGRYSEPVYKLLCQRDFRPVSNDFKHPCYTWKDYYDELQSDFWKRIRFAYQNGCDWGSKHADALQFTCILLLISLYFVFSQQTETFENRVRLTIFALVLIMFGMRFIVSIHMPIWQREARLVKWLSDHTVTRLGISDLVLFLPIMGLSISVVYRLNLSFPFLGCLFSGWSVWNQFDHFRSWGRVFLSMITMISDCLTSYLLRWVDTFSNLYVYIPVLFVVYADGMARKHGWRELIVNEVVCGWINYVYVLIS